MCVCWSVHVGVLTWTAFVCDFHNFPSLRTGIHADDVRADCRTVICAGGATTLADATGTKPIELWPSIEFAMLLLLACFDNGLQQRILWLWRRVCYETIKIKRTTINVKSHGLLFLVECRLCDASHRIRMTIVSQSVSQLGCAVVTFEHLYVYVYMCVCPWENCRQYLCFCPVSNVNTCSDTLHIHGGSNVCLNANEYNNFKNFHVCSVRIRLHACECVWVRLCFLFANRDNIHMCGPIVCLAVCFLLFYPDPHTHPPQFIFNHMKVYLLLAKLFSAHSYRLTQMS